MEKSIFFFRRKPDRSPAEFDHHYINNHAPLGKRLTRCLLGYTVNLLGTDGYPGAVTEHWVPAVMDILTPAIAYESMDDFNAVFVDDQSLFSGFELFVVTSENIVTDGPIPSAPLDQRTPGIKLIERFADAASLPPPHAGAARVVDNIVSHELKMTDDYSWNTSKAEMDVIRMSWFEDQADIGKIDGIGWLTQEYRFIAPPTWTDA